MSVASIAWKLCRMLPCETSEAQRFCAPPRCWGYTDYNTPPGKAAVGMQWLCCRFHASAVGKSECKPANQSKGQEYQRAIGHGPN
eukprot:2300100-Rhodomonas_salina.1